MGNKDSDQARQWLRLSIVFAGRIGHKVVVSLETFTDWLASSVSINLPNILFDLGKHSREICGLPPIIATTPSITFYSQFLCRVCNDIMVYSFTQCSKWQVIMNTFELAHFGQTLKK